MIFIDFIKRYDTQTNRTVSKAAYRMVPSSYKIFKETAGRLLDHRYPSIFNQAMMELGATICKPGKPECNGCPVCSLCHANQAGNVEKFPKPIINSFTCSIDRAPYKRT